MKQNYIQQKENKRLHSDTLCDEVKISVMDSSSEEDKIDIVFIIVSMLLLLLFRWVTNLIIDKTQYRKQ